MRGFVAPSVVYRTRGSKVRTYSRTKALACLHLRTSLLDPRLPFAYPTCNLGTGTGRTDSSQLLLVSSFAWLDGFRVRLRRPLVISFSPAELSVIWLSLSLQVPNHVEGKTRSAEACLPICSVAASARRVLLPRAVFGCVGDRKGHAVWEQGKRITEAVDQLAS